MTPPPEYTVEVPNRSRTQARPLAMYRLQLSAVGESYLRTTCGSE